MRTDNVIQSLKPSAPRKRMAAADRRQQMLDVAAQLIRQEGAAALTLAHIAEASGVSKPIAYQHFGTREGLLETLYTQAGRHYEAMALEALEAGRAGKLTRGRVAGALGASFMDCILEHGSLYSEISAALAAAGADAHVARMSFARRYAQALHGLVRGNKTAVYAFTVAFLGAGERLADAVLRGELSRDRAVETLAALLLAG